MSDGNIVNLWGEPIVTPSSEAEVVPEVIETLESLLELAKRGEISFITGINIRGDRDCIFSVGIAPNQVSRVVGLLDIMKQHHLKQVELYV